ncbi:MAG: mRNA-degrading endonuclease HigB of HigAB toxin-antitoxin module [Psychroserpens sp.]|jgi:mRNA-degrading endonuclease HigB of HigAB toxin-antitoxin module
MRLIGKHKLQPLLNGCSDTAIWVLAWADEIKNSVWLSENDIKDYYPSVALDNSGVFIFQVEPRVSAIKVRFCFVNKIACISQVIVSEE